MTKLFEADFDNFVEAEQTVDTGKLAAAIQSAFLLSMDTAVPVSLQGQLSASARTLRAQLKELLVAKFQAGIAELLAANKTIKTVNLQLKQAKADIDKVADTIEQLGALVAQLDKLLGIIGVVI